MSKSVYYIDTIMGDDLNDGLSSEQALKTYENMAFLPGDTVLFKRGGIIRGCLETCDGSEHGYITYGAYGTGEKPVFLGSISADTPESWIEEQPFIWRYKGAFCSEVCNIIFNHGEMCGNMRWDLKDLKSQGEWYYTCLGLNSETGRKNPDRKHGDGILYLFSSDNPGLFYCKIEIALWVNRKLVGGKSHVILENLSFQNGGVHGYQEIMADHIIIRNCEFKFIGGAVWDPDSRIRFGNAVEFWDSAQDILVENCIFNNIYDSGVTHQGSDGSGPYERIYFRDNLFEDCGMAAYECRGPAAGEVYFEHNTCINAGGGFSMQGEAPPRQSEIYPQPMGHHIFIWRINKNTQKGYVYIRNNIFYKAPYGAAIYSLIDPEDESRFVIDNNCYYQEEDKLLMHMGGKVYNAELFQLYQTNTGQDKQSIFADPMLIDLTLYGVSPSLAKEKI